MHLRHRLQPAARKILGASAAGLLIISLAAGCKIRRPGGDHAKRQVLYSGMISDPKTFNAVLVTDTASGNAIGNLFSGLVRMNPKTTLPEPDLAEKWEISPDGKTIVFHLRHGVQSFDGEPFTAKDVLFTLRAIYDPKVPNSERPSLTRDGKAIVA